MHHSNNTVAPDLSHNLLSDTNKACLTFNAKVLQYESKMFYIHHTDCSNTDTKY